ncbi:hypothetical protein [Hyphomonas sp.]|uniref:hypothetical protein n=1 Tax=Hyphomonas sp. TaxID=87 RepID=UPI0033415EB2
MLGAAEDDTLSFARTAHGSMISVSDEQAEKLREMAANVMKRRRKALKVLAQRRGRTGSPSGSFAKFTRIRSPSMAARRACGILICWKSRWRVR